jgi:NAD+ diphosphatase
LTFLPAPVAADALVWQAAAMFGSVCYTGSLLDRASLVRRDAAWLDARRLDPRTVIIPVWRDRSFVVEGDPPQAALIKGSLSATIIEGADQIVLLGCDGEGTAWFAADLSADSRDAIARIVEPAIPLPLRRVGAVLPPADAAVLAYAQGIVHWHRRHRFCGVCGSETESREGGHVRVCLGANCGAEHFPRTDPAVIMLVSSHDGEACLLARQARWPRGMYSTLAGFVEPGESLEEAVMREVREETGLRVADVRYRGSQPWPFPSSIMLGFHATAQTQAPITFDPNELEHARWFTRAEIAAFDEIGLRLPSRDSIARRLVVEWLDQTA